MSSVQKLISSMLADLVTHACKQYLTQSEQLLVVAMCQTHREQMEPQIIKRLRSGAFGDPKQSARAMLEAAQAAASEVQ